MCTATALLDRTATESTPGTQPMPHVTPDRCTGEICPLTGTGNCPADPEAARKCPAC
jgi:hypothetical protein